MRDEKTKLDCFSKRRDGLLTACGGGGGGGVADTETPVDALTKYVGTWRSVCDIDNAIFDSTTDDPARVVGEVVITKSSPTVLKWVPKTTVYASTDTACVGVPLGVIQSGATQGTWTLGTAGITSDGGGGIASYKGEASIAGKAVDKFELSTSALTTQSLPSSVVTAGSGNRFDIRPSDFPAETQKQIFFVNGGTMTWGDSISAANYPTDLQTVIAYTKQ